MTVQVDWGNVTAIGISIIFGAILVGIPLLIGAIRSHREAAFMTRIAGMLGFAYQRDGSAANTQAQGLAGGEIFDVISGVHNGVSVAAFTYRMWTSGKNGHWSYMTVLETPIPAALPDIVLRPIGFSFDEAAETALGRNSWLGNYEPVALEGNFGKYFTLYVTKGAHIEALEVFAPDIMADMIDHFQSYGLEFSKNTLYLYPMKLIKDDAVFMQALVLLEQLAKSLAPTLDAMPAVQEQVAPNA